MLLAQAVYNHAPPNYDCPFCAMVRGEENEPGQVADVVVRDSKTTAWVNGHCDGTSTRQHNEPGANQEVWHYHLHVFPRWEGDDVYRAEARRTTPEERAPYAAALREALARA